MHIKMVEECRLAKGGFNHTPGALPRQYQVQPASTNQHWGWETAAVSFYLFSLRHFIHFKCRSHM